MNASLRLLAFALLLLIPALSTVARDSSSARSGGGRYSVVQEYKEAYAKPRAPRSFFGFGKRKTAGQVYAKKHRAHRTMW